MSGTNIVYQGAVAPEAIRIKVLQGSSGIDLTTVTAAAFQVRQPSGAVLTWAAAIQVGATATQLTAVHTFILADTEQLGRHVIQAKLTVPAGIVRSVPATFQVIDPLLAGA